ncbi:toll/interleukin-1 receptor domain-containing protein [Tunturiibacter gelidoferens]|uniref:SEFIR domain-containing protein n=1 Tax=Tunturiibacter gelidiferens TaxID=3069689 RepID=A0A9X0U2Z1_9BACT|nr:toll/interleukin-1 receptor domain-containing protein [Edaphobacter lichenicola]MBB5327804.1 hypothetical protein [Edaphobacter lichenicola]
MNDPVQELWQVAPTLAELRKLPAEQKDRLFLAKLARMSRHDGSVLNKGNLMLGGDPYGFAHGFPDGEKQLVKEHLLGAPWTRLVNEGYLVDLNGQGFHKVSIEGHEFLKQDETPLEPAQAIISRQLPARVDGAPRVFLSYSWEGDEHKAWVRALAERLQKDGIQILFDKWYLKLGQDKLYFMEQAVTQSDFVAIVCTENYAEKANSREGGVGYESMIITGEVAEHMLTDKFIPVLRQGSFKTSLPIYLKSRLGVNLSAEPYSEDEYEELLRKLHGETLEGPALGKKPDFSKKPAKSASSPIAKPIASLPTTSPAAAIIDIHHGRNSVLTVDDLRLLLAAAADAGGRVIVQSTFDGYFVQANGENFAEDTPRSIAAWKRTLRRLVDMGYLFQLSDEVYEMTQEGFDRADNEEAAKPLSLYLSFAGDVDNQSLLIESNKPIKVKSVDLLMSSEASITTIDVNGKITNKTSVLMVHEKVVLLFNAPRPDKNTWDHSGPAALRIVYVASGRTSDVVLPILLQPAIKDNTQWIKLTGSKTFLQASGGAVAERKEGSYLLNSLEDRPNGILHAHYEKPGTAGRLNAAIRRWDVQGEVRYSFESDRGDEFVGSKKDVITNFFLFNQGLIREGYRRMSFMPGPDPDFQSL